MKEGRLQGSGRAWGSCGDGKARILGRMSLATGPLAPSSAAALLGLGLRLPLLPRLKPASLFSCFLRTHTLELAHIRTFLSPSWSLLDTSNSLSCWRSTSAALRVTLPPCGVPRAPQLLLPGVPSLLENRRWSVEAEKSRGKILLTQRYRGKSLSDFPVPQLSWPEEASVPSNQMIP